MKYVLIFFLLLTPAARGAVFDRIVAVVDEEIILQSDLAEFETVYRNQPGFSDMAEEELQKQLITKLIDEKVMLVVARRDTTIKITPAEIESRVKMHISRVVEENGGEERFETLLKQTNGMSLPEFKSQIKNQMNEQILKQKLQMKYCGNLDPSGLQVRDFYKEYKDSLPVLKNNYFVSHLEMGVTANQVLMKKAYTTCDSIIQLLNAGSDFSGLAKELSDDPSGEDGGNLGFTKRGTLDPDYENIAFRLRIGDHTRRPVKTQYGFHVIKVTGKRDVEIKTSHILIRTLPTGADTLRTINFLDSLRRIALKQGNFPELAKQFSEDKKSREEGGALGWFTENSLTQDYRDIIDSLSEGDISLPILINGKYHLFRLDKFVEERTLSLEDDWNQISMVAQNYLLNKKLEVFLDKWRRQVHIEKRLPNNSERKKEESGR